MIFRLPCEEHITTYNMVWKKNTVLGDSVFFVYLLGNFGDVLGAFGGNLGGVFV